MGRKEVTIVDGETVEVEAVEPTTTGFYVQWDQPANAPATTTYVSPPSFWRQLPVMQSSLYLRGTDYHICSLETPMPNWFRRQLAKLAGFEWREC